MTEESTRDFISAVEDLHETMKAMRDEAAATKATALVARETAEMVRGIVLGPAHEPEKGLLFRLAAIENVAKDIAKYAKYGIWLLGVLVAVLAARMGIDVGDVTGILANPAMGSQSAEVIDTP